MGKPIFPVPKAWQTGLAIPANMQAEGLREGAYVTQWAPRGTYDDPDPYSNNGWDNQPDYILKEGYGQGAKVTFWPDRGTYVGAVKREEQQVKRAQRALGDVTVPPQFAAYGQKSAATIIAQVMQYPPANRRQVMKGILDKIDPSLFNRVESIAKSYKGVDQMMALRGALAKAMSEGFTKEVVDTGRTRRAPKPNGLLGLGVYGGPRRRARFFARGAAPMGDTTLRSAATSALAVTAQAQIVPIAEGTCSADKQFVFRNGAWQRPRAGEVLNCTATTSGSPTVRDQTSGAGSGGGVTVTNTQTGETTQTKVDVAPDLKLALLEVGPFKFMSDNPAGSSIQWSGQLPIEQRDYILKAGKTDTVNSGVSGGDTMPASSWADLPKILSIPTNFPINPKFMGSIAKMPSQNATSQDLWTPFARYTHPVTGKIWGIFCGVTMGAGVTPKLVILTRRIEKSWYESLWDWIVDFVAKVIDVVGGVLSDIGDFACGVLNSPTAVVAGAAAGAAVGGAGGAQAGAAGVGLAQTICGSGQPPPSSSVEDDFPLLPVAIAGGVVLAIAAFWPKKKRT